MLHNRDGDLLASDCTVILHQANCHSVMGAGIAKGIAIKYPEAAQVDKDFELTPEARFGTYTTAVIDGVRIVNLYGQYNTGLGRHTNYHMLERALNEFLTNATHGSLDADLTKVGVPYGIGCGLGGGDWTVVSEILAHQSELHGIDIYIYKL